MAGGAEQYLCRLYGELKGAGDEPFLVGSVPGWREAGLRGVSANLGPKWAGRSFYRRAPALPFERRRVAAAIAASQHDVAHVQFKREQIGLTDLLSRRSPVIWTEHGRLEGNPDLPKWRPLYRAAARRASAIICVSELVAGDVEAVTGAGARIHVIENAVDTTRFAASDAPLTAHARASVGVSPSETVALWAGRLTPSKLPALAVEAASVSSASFLIAGSGPERENAERVASKCTNVRFLGHQTDMAALYAAADVFLFTSNGAGEGLPYVLVEAAASGLPIVVNEGSGFANAIPGLVTAPDNPAALASAIARAAAEGAPSELTAWGRSRGLSHWLEAHRTVMRRCLA